MHSRRRWFVCFFSVARFGQFAPLVISFSALLAAALTRSRGLSLASGLCRSAHTLPCCITTAVLLVTPLQDSPLCFMLFSVICTLFAAPHRLLIPVSLYLSISPSMPMVHASRFLCLVHCNKQATTDTHLVPYDCVYHQHQHHPALGYISYLSALSPSPLVILKGSRPLGTFSSHCQFSF
ncbi:hypothetical protein V8D89_001248 [Ganoderma adspersum]